MGTHSSCQTGMSVRASCYSTRLSWAHTPVIKRECLSEQAVIAHACHGHTLQLSNRNVCQSKLLKHTPVMGTHSSCQTGMSVRASCYRTRLSRAHTPVVKQGCLSEQAVKAHACHGHTLQLSNRNVCKSKLL